MKKYLVFLYTMVLIFGLVKSAAAISIGLLNADSYDVSNVINGLVSTGQFTTSDITNISQNTTNLANYDAILAWSNYRWNNPTAIGNALANYVDNGGGLVLATYNFSSSWGISGNILNPGYSPYHPVSPGTGSPFSGILDMTTANHAIFQGITSIRYWENSNYTDPTLSGIELAEDTLGNSVVAINSAGNIIGINIFPGYMLNSRTNQGTRDLFANALIYVSNQHPNPVPEPSTVLLLGVGLIGLASSRKKIFNR